MLENNKEVLIDKLDTWKSRSTMVESITHPIRIAPLENQMV